MRPPSGTLACHLRTVASFVVIVDAQDDTAHRFYDPESFLALPEQAMKLLCPIADIRQVFDES